MARRWVWSVTGLIWLNLSWLSAGWLSACQHLPTHKPMRNIPPDVQAVIAKRQQCQRLVHLSASGQTPTACRYSNLAREFANLRQRYANHAAVVALLDSAADFD